MALDRAQNRRQQRTTRKHSRRTGHHGGSGTSQRLNPRTLSSLSRSLLPFHKPHRGGGRRPEITRPSAKRQRAQPSDKHATSRGRNRNRNNVNCVTMPNPPATRGKVDPPEKKKKLGRMMKRLPPFRVTNSGKKRKGPPIICAASGIGYPTGTSRSILLPACGRQPNSAFKDTGGRI